MRKSNSWKCIHEVEPLRIRTAIPLFMFADEMKYVPTAPYHETRINARLSVFPPTRSLGLNIREVDNSLLRKRVICVSKVRVGSAADRRGIRKVS